MRTLMSPTHRLQAGRLELWLHWALRTHRNTIIHTHTLITHNTHVQDTHRTNKHKWGWGFISKYLYEHRVLHSPSSSLHFCAFMKLQEWETQAESERERDRIAQTDWLHRLINTERINCDTQRFLKSHIKVQCGWFHPSPLGLRIATDFLNWFSLIYKVLIWFMIELIQLVPILIQFCDNSVTLQYFA